jgi:hypothetical protein
MASGSYAKSGRYAKTSRLRKDRSRGGAPTQHDVTVEKAIRELGWAPRTLRQSVLDTAETLISAGIVRPRKPMSKWSPSS